MTVQANPILDEALAMLVELAQLETPPDDAWAAVRNLQECHPDTSIDLVWERETFDRSVHYDLLLAIAEDATVSLSYCQDRALPWPLRGVQRSSERSLLRVNSDVLTVDQAIAHLDFVWDEQRVTERLIDACLIREELLRRPLEPTAEEIDRALAAFRRTRGLLTAEATIAWMDLHGLSIENLRRIAADGLAATRLRARVTDGQVEPFFETHRSEFDLARAFELVVPTEAQAAEIAYRIDVDGADFLDAVERFITDSTTAGAPTKLQFTSHRRNRAPAHWTRTFAANPGEIVGPLPCEGGFALLKVLSVEPAEFNPAVRADIETRLFAEWLAERRANAHIQWYWGQAARTGAAPQSGMH